MILVRPIITEKTLHLASLGQYTFEVDRRANALEVGRAVAEHYHVPVATVRTQTVRGVLRRSRRGSGQTRSFKKAIVRLATGAKISGFELEVEKPIAEKNTTKAPAGKEA